MPSQSASPPIVLRAHMKKRFAIQMIWKRERAPGSSRFVPAEGPSVWRGYDDFEPVFDRVCDGACLAGKNRKPGGVKASQDAARAENYAHSQPAQQCHSRLPLRL